MSERASFVTEFIYCPRCFEHVESALMSDSGGWLDGQVTIKKRIIAGKISSSAHGEENLMMSRMFNTDNAPCHPVRIVILSDSGNTYICVVNSQGIFDRVATIGKDVIKTHLSGA